MSDPRLTAPREYRGWNEPDLDAERIRIEKIHNTYPTADATASVFDPSGLVPYPCDHGIPAKPKRFPATKGGTPWLDASGDERPPYGGKSFGRAKYLVITSFGGRSGVPYAYASCFVCEGKPVGDDFYVAADGTSLR